MVFACGDLGVYNWMLEDTGGGGGDSQIRIIIKLSLLVTNIMISF